MEIWQEILDDREAGARKLVSVYYDRVLASALMLCRDRAKAEDLVFRTFSQVVEKITSFKPNSSFYNWLYTILLNYRRMDFRKEGRDKLVPVEELPEIPDERTPAQALAAKVDHAKIRQAVAELSEGLRTVVVLRYFEGFSLEEIAEATELPLGTVKSRLNYAKSVLVKSLSGTFGQEV